MTQQAPMHAREHPWAAASLLAPTALAEALILLELPLGGAIVHALIVQFGLLAYLAAGHDAAILDRMSLRPWVDRVAPLLPALALLSIVRLLSLTLATDSISELLWYGLVGATSVAAALLAARALGLGYSEIGLRADRERPVGLFQLGFLGVLLGILGYITIDTDDLMPTTDDANAFVVAITLVLFVAVMEELVFRGLVQRAALAVLGRRAWLWSSAAYVIMLIGTDSLAVVLVLGLAGLLFGLRVQQTGSLAGVTLAHSLMRISLLLVLPALFPA